MDEDYGQPSSRKNGLPYDEARQNFRKHHARLINKDKSGETDIEKKILDIRKPLIFAGEKLYIQKQAETLGVDLGKDKSRSR